MNIETLKPEQFGWRNLNTLRLETYPSTSDGNLPGWGLPSWQENFDTALDPLVWNIRNGYADAQDASVMRPANVVVENSSLKISAKKQTDGSREYTSGYIDTIGKWTRRYGRWEFRAKLPTQPGVSRGMWPGFWLRDASGGGEVDIMETIGTPNNHPEVYPTGGGRYSSSLYKQTGVGQGTSEYWSRIFSNINVGDDAFHTWAFEWTPNGMIFICDGIVQHTVTKSDYDTNFAAGFPSSVNFRIDLFVGSNWGGFPNDTDTVLPRVFEIDYIRYWDMP